MTLAVLEFDKITERDLVDLIDAGTPEGELYDYKRAPYGISDSDKREFSKRCVVLRKYIWRPFDSWN